MGNTQKILRIRQMIRCSKRNYLLTLPQLLELFLLSIPAVIVVRKVVLSSLSGSFPLFSDEYNIYSDAEKISLAFRLFSSVDLLLPRKNRFITEWLSISLTKSAERDAADPRMRFDIFVRLLRATCLYPFSDDYGVRPHQDQKYWELFVAVIDRIMDGND